MKKTGTLTPLGRLKLLFRGSDQESKLFGPTDGQEGAMAEASMSSATDRDIEEIVRENEAGVADLMAAYELSEQRYFSAALASTPQPAVISTTSSAS